MTSVEEDDVYEFPYVRPEKRGLIESWKRELWNPETRQILGRTGKSWGGVFIFYVIFFSALAAMFAICMKGMLWFMDDKRPRYLLDDSIIGSNPGLGFRPISDEVSAGALIWYQASNESNYRRWTDQLDKFLEPYHVAQKLPGGGKNQQVCDFDQPPQDGKVCEVNVKNFQPCTMEMGYGFNRSSPCIFIKLNKIYGWVPEFYERNKLPEDIPEDLKIHILKTNPKELNQVWVSCKGDSPSDSENMGPISYIPGRGFPGYYYPYTNIDGYLSPLIAIHLARPKLNTVINIECRAWAKNIKYFHQQGHRQGSVLFEVMID
ncbi:sodium/potassium-transporting ATPase subunit beta-2 isoform X1 [Cryptotermes secundus]|uniref:sodium/potassium-transporting ATPase subunit beta-2 isoform X1 n=1 Tax=Cryptotermes secundus TaxID=105785 RepID=UPI000CD7AD13|nr:sodium/potassium-transporting ATPase subunit beta-2 isoform X1 [Cryptotermes secundus]XP_023708793.1 sodium/potassium-transporting ATPase subunit beta-2 isoform X1 [Cryptotermes secundus]XP_023708794.1 sodium/potassium-transporting ATPase subunit beta-2 isoform X1 [Cryptotermes secundus]